MRNARSLSLSIAALFGLALFLLGCNSSSSLSPSNATVRAYNGTASVGDFLTISIDSDAHTITYDNLTNGESGTATYSANSDGSYTITDPNGNLPSAYEVPGYVMVLQAANTGPNRDTTALITAIESVTVTLHDFEGTNFNMTQFRTRDGGVEIGTVTVDTLGNMTARSYDPGAIMWTPSNYFNGGTFPASTTQEDSSGTFFTVLDQNGSRSTVFGTQNGLWAVDTNQGAVLRLPKAATKDFDPAFAGTYNTIYYEKTNAQMQNNVEVGTPSEERPVSPSIPKALLPSPTATVT